jgi:hypothetical protein
VVVFLVEVVLSAINSRDSKSVHETRGNSNEKLSCLFVESFISSPRVGALSLSMAQKFSFSKVISCWLEGHGSNVGKGDDGHSASQRCEMNGK